MLFNFLRYQKVKGQPQIGEVPANYRCNKCKKVGHWIKNCPYTGKDHIEMKRTTGIPKSFREKDDRYFFHVKKTFNSYI